MIAPSQRTPAAGGEQPRGVSEPRGATAWILPAAIATSP